MTVAKKQQNMQDFDFSTEKKPQSDAQCLVNLYQGVIMQAFIDYYSGHKSRRAEYFRKQAYNWIMIDNPGFNQVCEFAEVVPERIRETFLKYGENKDDFYFRLADIFDTCCKKNRDYIAPKLVKSTTARI